MSGSDVGKNTWASPDSVLADDGIVRLQVDSAIASVTVGAGERRNVLGVAAWNRLRDVARQISRADTVKLVVLRGAAGTFSAGFDIREWRGCSPAYVDASFNAMEAALQSVEDIPVPTIAVVEGVAAGAGCELALACDLRIMAASARIGMPILRLGILPSPLFALRLAAVAGLSRSRKLLYTGWLLDADEAQRWGLATDVAADPDLDSHVERLIGAIAAQPRTGLLASKAATSVEQQHQRAQHGRPDWRFSDGAEFSRRVLAFVNGARSRHSS